MPKIQEMDLEDVMGDRFGRYSKYIIQERALPDIRDGLKPVQRRILFAMNQDGNTYDKGFRKSAKSVGNVMGNFHPHGDSSIYEAMVRLSQDWKLREPLIQMHGNNGSLDGDPPAAMRYTEARLSKISGEMLKDIDKDTVEMILNFDDTEKEPTVLPAGFPNLLVNGATGISAGYATEIPPHNLSEVIDSLIYLLDHPNADLDKMMTFIPGPDFPGGGILQGVEGIKQAYETGRGKVVLRAKTQINELKGGRQAIQVTELPYEVNKANLVKKIDEIRFAKKVDGISEIRDESDRRGMSIVIELKRNADTQSILNYLFKNTELQISYNFNMVAISHERPIQASLLDILRAYLEHRADVITKRTQYNLAKAQKRQHIVLGLIKAISILDEVIATIRNSKNRKDAQQNIMSAYGFTETQADAIVTLQLYRLTNTDITTLKEENKDLESKITGYQKILNDANELDKVIKQELREIKKTYGNPRRTQIEAEVQSLTIDTTVTVPNEDVMVLVSRDGYLKRSSLRSYQASNPGENGLKPTDETVFLANLNTLEHLYIFTNHGNMIYRPVYEVEDAKFKDAGEHLSQTVGLKEDEKIIGVWAFSDLEQTGNFVVGTSSNYIKQIAFSELGPKRNYKSKATSVVKLGDSDRMVNVQYISTPTDDLEVFSASDNGYGLRFNLSEIPTSGAKAAGVKLMDLKNKTDKIVNFIVYDPEVIKKVSILTQRGAYKKMSLADVPATSRARRGVQILRELKQNPHRVWAMEPVEKNQILQVVTDKPETIEIDPTEFRSVDRYSNGTFVIDTQTQGNPERISMIDQEPEATETE